MDFVDRSPARLTGDRTSRTKISCKRKHDSEATQGATA
jgi:hypothetical protein